MKKITLSILLQLLYLSITYSQVTSEKVCVGDVTLSSQAEVDAFDCTEVTGSLNISGSDITNLDALFSLRRVAGLFIENNPSLTNLDSLSSLESIDGALVIITNPSLLNLNGFHSLISVSRNLHVAGNLKLTEIKGFNNLTGVGGISVRGSQSIDKISGFASLVTIAGDLTIDFNPELLKIEGFESLTSIQGSVEVAQNTSLENISGFTKVTTISGILRFDTNAALTNIDGFSELRDVVDIMIADNAHLTNVEGFSSLKSIQGNLYISSNPELSDISAFNSLDSIRGSLNVEGSKLVDLKSFSSLTCVGSIMLSRNNNLMNVDALYNLKSVNSVVGVHAIQISNNAQLTNLDGLTLVGNDSIGSIQINNNASLKTINGFSSLTTIFGFLSISDNPLLMSFNGFNKVTSLRSSRLGATDVSTSLSIGNNPSLLNLDGVSSLKIIEGFRGATLRITNNLSLSNIDGLSSLELIDGSLAAGISIQDNPALKNVTGLSSLSRLSWGGSASILITNNAVLENIDGLASLNDLPDEDLLHITITRNPLLTGCSAFFALLGTFEKVVIQIAENGLGCMSEDIPGRDDIDPIINFVGEPDATSIVLKWTPYSGIQTITEYRVLRSGQEIGRTIGKYGYFTDHGLDPSFTYFYEVEGLDINGNVICRSTSIQVSTTSQSSIKTHYNLLAIAFDLNSESELDHVRTFLRYRLDFLKHASHNSVNLDIYNDDITLIHSSPPLEQNSTSVDYVTLASTVYPELDNNTIVDLIERYDIDIVWVVGAPTGYDFGENALMGNTNLGNDTWISNKVKSSRSFFIHGYLSDARAFDAAAHHVEGTMTSATEKSLFNWPKSKEYLVYTKDRADFSVYPEKLNLFEQFRLTDEWTGIAAYASKGNANCGSSHFIPGSIRNSVNYPDYTYYDREAWLRYVDCYADDWLNYPNSSGEPRKINGFDFGAFNNYQENTTTASFGFGTASFHYWWFNHIPHNPGVMDEKLNNWWPYIYDCNRFDGSAIRYTVDGFPTVPVTYNTTNAEYGTEETDTALNWMYWHSNTDFGQRADLSMVGKSENPEYVKNGQLAIKVDVDVESFSINGRNDLTYPSFKNAHWQFSNIDSIIFSVKFDSQDLLIGANPILRICKNGNNRIEFTPIKAGVYTNLFNNEALKDSAGWYTFYIPISGNNSWQRNVIGYIDPDLGESDQEQAKQQIIKQILEDVNYFEISIQSNGSRGESLVYYIDNLKIHHKDTTNASQSISSFSLINESTGAVVKDFYDSTTLDRADPDFSKWTIQANTSPDTVGSVVFRVNKKIKHTENVFPYTLPKSILSHLNLGTHTITTNVYSKPHKQGEQGIGRTLIINIINSIAILNFDVVDATGKVLMNLNDGDKINIKDPAFRSFSIRANTTPDTVGSVRFWLNNRYVRTENVVPYSIAGDQNGNFYPCSTKPGQYSLLATPYSKTNAKGYAGKSLKIHFSVVKEHDHDENRAAENARSVTDQETITYQGEETSVSIYPVPVENELFVKLNNQAGNNVLIKIRNIQGQLVYTATYVENYGINTLGLQSGVYYLQILGNNGFGKVIKFIKK